jgi:hypothetical protein
MIDADFANGNADTLNVTGSASLSGTIQVNPLALRNQKVTAVSAEGSLTFDPSLTASRSFLVGYTVQNGCPGRSSWLVTPMRVR